MRLMAVRVVVASLAMGVAVPAEAAARAPAADVAATCAKETKRLEVDCSPGNDGGPCSGSLDVDLDACDFIGP